MYTPEMLEQMKKQWKSMGIDPNQMLKFMNNNMEMQNNFQSKMEDAVNQALNSNPLLQNMMNMGEGGMEGDMLNMFDDSPEVKPDSELNAEEQKAVLCGANISYNNSMYVNTLSTFMPVDDIAGGLEGAWGISSKEELVDTIEWLAVSGHRVYFNLIWGKLTSLPKAEWRSGISDLELESLGYDDIEESRLMEFARNLLETYSLLLHAGCFTENTTPDLTAWDYERAINLCRFGFDVGYFSRAEALEKIMSLASVMYEKYDSWKEMSFGYLIGFGMWSGDQAMTEDRIEQNQTLLSHKQSPWVDTSFK